MDASGSQPGGGQIIQGFCAHMRATSLLLAHVIQEQVALNRKKPCFQVTITAALLPTADGALQRVLNEIVRRFLVTQQRPGIAS